MVAASSGMAQPCPGDGVFFPFVGEVRAVDVMLVNAYSSETLRVTGTYRVSTGTYAGSCLFDTIAGTTDADLLTIRSQDGGGDVVVELIDRIIGNSSDDVIVLADAGLTVPGCQVFGNAGNDVIWTGDGDDNVRGDAGNDRIDGGPGNDLLDGGPDDDVVRGGSGADVLFGRTGTNLLFGGPGADQYVFGPMSGASSSTGGHDTIVETLDGATNELEGFGPSEAVFVRGGVGARDLIITITGRGSVTISNQFATLASGGSGATGGVSRLVVGRATPTEQVFALPRCPGDFNASGLVSGPGNADQGVSVQDIFDYLAAYFDEDPRADTNASGGLSVQDIFDFLAAYFAGC